MRKQKTASGPQAHDITVDVLVMGSGTGLAAALAAKDKGMSVVVVEKTAVVGGSTARSGGAYWIPGNAALRRGGADLSPEKAKAYLKALVGDSSPPARYEAFLEHGPAAIDVLERMTNLRFLWTKEYADYHSATPGSSELGRTCESRPYDVNRLGKELARFRPSLIKSPLPMAITSVDYRWINLMKVVPHKGLFMAAKRVIQGVGGLLIGRRYVAGGQAIAAGMFEGVIRAGIPVWTRTSVVELIQDGDRVSGAIVEQDGQRYRITARRGVVLAAGGYDHDMSMRQRYQSPRLTDDISLGAEGNTGDAIKLATALGAGVHLMNESWWFPAVKSPDGGDPLILLAERATPGCIIVDHSGKRFLNEAIDYMSFGQKVLKREAEGDPIREMWMIFDRKNRSSYVLAGGIFPGQDLPKAWYEAGIGFKANDPTELAKQIGVPVDAFVATIARFNAHAAQGVDLDFHRGETVYDRYYGDPTVQPNPNLRALEGRLYAVRLVLSDLGTCGGLSADEHARVLRTDGSVVAGLYAIGNTAANAFGHTYPGAGATIGQGIAFGYIAAQDMAKTSSGLG